MNFLELAKNLRQEAGLSGTGPSAVTGQVGMDAKIVSWVADAWDEIEMRQQNWPWLWRNDGVVTTVAGQREYNLAALGFSVSKLVEEAMRRRIAAQPGSEHWLNYYEYEQFRGAFLFGDEINGLPTGFTLSPSGTLLLEPVPDAAYELRFEYYTTPTPLTANTSEPAMPAQFHKAIVYLALMKYAAHDGAMEVYQDADRNYRKWMRRIENSQLPQQFLTGPLA